VWREILCDFVTKFIPFPVVNELRKLIVASYKVGNYCSEFVVVICMIVVGEEDEVSIKDVADMIVEAMNFTGEVIVSFCVEFFIMYKMSRKC